jgi:hypothetical protein
LQAQGADIALVSSYGARFKVVKLALAMASPLFRTVFQDPKTNKLSSTEPKIHI